MSEYIYGEIVVESHEYGGGIRTEIVKMGDRRERIVRCRDCSMAEYDNWVDTENVSWCGRFENLISPNGFCAWGEESVG